MLDLIGLFLVVERFVLDYLHYECFWDESYNVTSGVHHRETIVFGLKSFLAGLHAC